MKRIASIIAVLALVLAGCANFVTVNPPAKSLVAPVPQFRTGALPGPIPGVAKLKAHPLGAKLLAAMPVTAGGVLPANRMPIGYQQAQDCGPWEIACIAYPVTHQQFSPRATYVWSRQFATPANWTADAGTFAYANIHVAQTMGQPRVSVWPYAGSINQVPTAATVADAVPFELTPLLTPDLPSMEAALAGGNAVGIYVAATQEWWYPAQCADGSFEVRTPTKTSISIGGHFPTVVWFDLTRKMLDGTTGGMLCENYWGTQWGQAGYAWISIAGWVNNINGNLSQNFTLLGKAPLPPAPVKIHGSIVVAKGIVSWSSSGATTAKVNGAPEPLNGSMPVTGAPKYDFQLFDASGAMPADGSGWYTAYP